MYKKLQHLMATLKFISINLDKQGDAYQSKQLDVVINELIKIAEDLKRTKRG